MLRIGMDDTNGSSGMQATSTIVSSEALPSHAELYVLQAASGSSAALVV